MSGFCNLCEDPVDDVFAPTIAYTGSRVPLHSPMFRQGSTEYGMNLWGYKQESFARSWPSLVCESLHSTCHTTSWSGFGMFRHCCGGKINIPEIFPSTLGSDANSPIWNFSSWVPDAVVINLGTNDRLEQDKGSRDLKYMEVYYNFVLNITRWYGDATRIFLGCGPMSNEYCEHVHKVIARLLRNTNALKVHFLDHRNLMDQSNSCCNHPNTAGDEALARVATRLIGETMKWTHSRGALSRGESNGNLSNGNNKNKGKLRHGYGKHCEKGQKGCDP
jgi:hypothetical protein